MYANLSPSRTSENGFSSPESLSKNCCAVTSISKFLNSMLETSTTNRSKSGRKIPLFWNPATGTLPGASSIKYLRSKTSVFGIRNPVALS